MAYVKYVASDLNFVPVPSWFIMDYMPKALNGYSKVYFYLLALCTTPIKDSLSLEQVAKELNMLYSEVLQALRYWDAEGVIIFKEESSECFELEFKQIKPEIVTSANKLPLTKTIISSSRPEYRPEEINIYIEKDPDIPRLFKIAEEYLGRLLTFTDQKILFSLYDWLHMPFELIEYLIEYCASTNSKVTMRYIEKVAISWLDDGITTLEQAKEKGILDKKYFKILASLGSSKTNITLAEKKCIDRWLNEYGMSTDLILEACKRAVMQTNKPSLNYVDSILRSWSEAKVKSLEDISLIDKAREAKKQLGMTSPSPNKPPNKATKFTNIYSHNWDFDEIQKLEREYVQRKLNGGS
ncbi:hypothetical protein CS063_10905 [Sporanaerobium hydrogeniformans]|uniref:Uncharacterized protein n=1 Tax=Sporanaerobium hydrogeniformans TaxID=3072179 RepID=A0AC61DAY0_9FIRM|nr:DnaD domain protein [Sporanaerobium hydrogeniformans]PHV70380.1 hypothetical protein CS063_10905 [Sporanaerobium hydrogeniformans]